MQIDLAALPDDPATLQQMLREVVTAAEQQQTTLQQRDAEIDSKRCGGDGAGFELTIGAAADPAAKQPGW